jgi:hypothetical protein
MVKTSTESTTIVDSPVLDLRTAPSSTFPIPKEAVTNMRERPFDGERHDGWGQSATAVVSVAATASASDFMNLAYGLLRQQQQPTSTR